MIKLPLPESRGKREWRIFFRSYEREERGEEWEDGQLAGRKRRGRRKRRKVSGVLWPSAPPTGNQTRVNCLPHLLLEHWVGGRRQRRARGPLRTWRRRRRWSKDDPRSRGGLLSKKEVFFRSWYQLPSQMLSGCGWSKKCCCVYV